MQPQDVQAVLTLMAERVPRTLEAMLLHALSPAAAELLTQKLEQADAAASATGSHPTFTCKACLFMLCQFPSCSIHICLLHFMSCLIHQWHMHV